MKMQFLTVAAAVLMAAPMVHAQATTTPPPAKAPTAMGRHRGHGDGMMKDLNLTADQQARMKTIRAKYAPQMKTARAAAKPDFDAMRAARARGDTAAMRTAREKLRSDMAPNKQVMDQQLTEMRSVLTPEQQKTFDADRAKMQTRMAQRGRRAGMDHPKPAQPASK